MFISLYQGTSSPYYCFYILLFIKQELCQHDIPIKIRILVKDVHKNSACLAQNNPYVPFFITPNVYILLLLPYTFINPISMPDSLYSMHAKFVSISCVKIPHICKYLLNLFLDLPIIIPTDYIKGENILCI